MPGDLASAKRDVQHLEKEHMSTRDFLTKLGKDNIGMLAAFVSWNILTSIAPIIVGLVAISGLFLRSPSFQHQVITHLSAATQGALGPKELKAIVAASVKHTGLLAIVGLLGALWGGSNVGGSLSTAFQAIFETRGRNFIVEKLIDIGMIVVFTILMVVILVGTAAGSLLNHLFAGIGLPVVVEYAVGTVISLAAAFLLFAAVYLVFPHIQPGLKFGNVWKGALLSAVLFQILSYVWPIYSHFAHFGRYGTVFVPILILTAWIYFFSVITMLGAEVTAVGAIREAQRTGQSEGPPPQDSVPQHRVLREQRTPQGTPQDQTGAHA